MYFSLDRKVPKDQGCKKLAENKLTPLKENKLTPIVPIKNIGMQKAHIGAQTDFL
jgi:hypothetical protein